MTRSLRWFLCVLALASLSPQDSNADYYYHAASGYYTNPAYPGQYYSRHSNQQYYQAGYYQGYGYCQAGYYPTYSYYPVQYTPPVVHTPLASTAPSVQIGTTTITTSDPNFRSVAVKVVGDELKAARDSADFARILSVLGKGLPPAAYPYLGGGYAAGTSYAGGYSQTIGTTVWGYPTPTPAQVKQNQDTLNPDIRDQRKAQLVQLQMEFAGEARKDYSTDPPSWIEAQAYAVKAHADAVTVLANAEAMAIVSRAQKPLSQTTTTTTGATGGTTPSAIPTPAPQDSKPQSPSQGPGLQAALTPEQIDQGWRQSAAIRCDQCHGSRLAKPAGGFHWEDMLKLPVRSTKTGELTQLQVIAMIQGNPGVKRMPPEKDKDGHPLDKVPEQESLFWKLRVPIK